MNALQNITFATLIMLFIILAPSCGNNTNHYTTSNSEETEIEESIENGMSNDFVEGGHTYIGSTSFNAGEYSTWENDKKVTYPATTGKLTYKITTYNDGTATWREESTYDDGRKGREQEWEGTWEKQMASKHDVEYVWYLFKVKAYSMNDGYVTSIQGAIDEDGNLYTFSSFDAPFSNETVIDKIVKNRQVCQVAKE